MRMCMCVSLGDPPGYQQTGWLIHAERTRDLEDCFSTSGDRDWVGLYLGQRGRSALC